MLDQSGDFSRHSFLMIRRVDGLRRDRLVISRTKRCNAAAQRCCSVMGFASIVKLEEETTCRSQTG